MAEWKQVSANRSFNGIQYVFSFKSAVLKVETPIGVYVPDLADGEKAPLLLYLSGLTCSEKNFVEKAGAQRLASKHKVILVNPDTSPRGLNIEGDKESYDFGEGAGFYVDATQPKWAPNYRMYSYIVKELVPLVVEKFAVDPTKKSILGHSMGGHGAITIGLKNPDLFTSISAFAPICNPSKCPWGEKALTGYLGPDQTQWADYDATELAKSYKGPSKTILVDQGTADNFYKAGQLLPENLISVQNPAIEVDFRLRDGYDHSYFYISTFIEEHFQFHLSQWK